jgi:peroxiredoxin
MIPAFQLMSADGRAVNIWDYKGRENLVLAFLPGMPGLGDLEFLENVRKSYEQYEEENAEFLAVLRGDMETATALFDQMHPPFPILYDERGEVTARYTDDLPAVFVADKFGELYAEWICEYPSQKQILDVAELINLECPE